jgi:beta-glucanase (GH16 family)
MQRRVTRVLLVAALAAAGLTAALASGTGSAGADPAWTTVWQDDFTGAAGSAPSSDNWRYDTGPGSNFGTGEIETMTSSTANVDLDGNGDLAITPLRDGNGNWTSGRIETNRDDFQAPAGGQIKIEARMSLPDVTGDAALGYWPAFWALGTPLRNGGTWPDVGEYDAMEDVNGQNLTYGTLHCGVNPGGPCNESSGLGGSVACPGSACTGNFHTYAFVLDTGSNTMTWYVDGQAYHTVTEDQVGSQYWTDATNHGLYVIFDLAMGGGFPNGVSGQTTPTGATDPGHPMLVDYVSVSTA